MKILNNYINLLAYEHKVNLKKCKTNFTFKVRSKIFLLLNYLIVKFKGRNDFNIFKKN